MTPRHASVRLCVALSGFFAAPILSHAQVRTGDIGTLEFRMARSRGAGTLPGVRVEVLDAPLWLKVLPESPLGPIDLPPGGEFNFRVDYEIGPELAQVGPAALFSVRISHESPDVRPQAKTWRFETADALFSHRAVCTTSDGASCGVVLAPDRQAPVASVVYEGPAHVSFSSAILSSGVTFISTRTILRLEALDPASSDSKTSGVAYIGTRLNAFVFNHSQLEISSTAFQFPEGPYYVVFAAVDLAGNRQPLQEVDLRADGTSPETTLHIGQPKRREESGEVLISASTEFRLDAVEVSSDVVTSGVRETLFSIEGSTFTPVSGAIHISGPDGPKDLRWFSRDNVLNEEATKSAIVVLDSTPPSLTLSCLAADSPDFCRIFDVAAPLRGSVQDFHLASWRLESAPGRAATDGFVLISSGTESVDGLLGALDAASLSGFITLRLSAEDAVANAASLTLDVFAGDPAQVFALGGHKTFEKPSGLAVDSSSRIYIADAGRDLVLVYAPDGSFVRSYGTTGSREPAFKETSGVAVDPSGDIWVADTGNHRAVKLSPEGDVLALVGNHETKRGLKFFKPGKGPAEFIRPEAIAVDAAGRAYVADTNNGRVQVLGPDGAFLREITIPGENDSRGMPAGLAVDGSGKVYVADRKARRVVVFSPAGNLLRTIEGVFEQPWGVAVNSDGRCLTVSDRKSGLVRRFDEEGRALLTFQAGGKPLGLALGDILYVAEEESDRVLGFGMPIETPIVASGVRPEPGKGFKAASAQASISEPALARIGRAGGFVLRSDGAGVDVPEGALDEEFDLSAAPAEAPASSQGLVSAGPAVEFGPHGIVFDRPVTIRLPYTGSSSGLAVHYFDETAARWTALPTTFGDGLARAETSHFSVYQVLGPEPGQEATLSPTAAADAAFAFWDLYAFPNPARGSRRPTIRLQVGVADSVEVNVYDVSGERVHSAAFGPPIVLDDGNGKGPQWTYDHAWDASGAGSGVYIYVVTAKKAGHSDIRKSGRLAVIR